MIIATGRRNSTPDQLAPSTSSATEDALPRARTLRAELEKFAGHLANIYEGYFQDFPTHMHMSFYHDVLSEVENLEKDIYSEDALSRHRISSSNLPYLHAVWDAAKNSKDIVKLRHPVFSGPFKRRVLAPGIRIKDIMSQGGSEPKRDQDGRSIRIDLICDGGLSWYRVSTITNRRLLFDMAKEAMYCGDSDDSGSAGVAAEDLSDVPLVKMARTLKTVAQGHRIRNSNPVPGLILPRIWEGEHAEIDRLINLCRDMGLRVLSGNELVPPPPLSEDLLLEMVPSPRRSITPELNIDTSVLVALTSDISHLQITKQPWFGQSQKDHIDLEASGPLIPQLCSLLEHHTLVCTREAATSLARIVHTMGTASENARAHLLLTPDDSITHEQRVKSLRALSIHGDGVLSRLQLPIRVADTNIDLEKNGRKDELDMIIREQLEVLAQPGRSVFSWGWSQGLTTVTCNICA
ncbi:hypothetical protein F5Y14DRAFT_395381 [Nemania sp. NC0429]|nr:hypothetical protein F5Y14DRAFT_395381 [Nemania sp. NC0429]